MRKIEKLLCAMVLLGALGCARQPAEKPIPVAEMPAEIILDDAEEKPAPPKPIVVPQAPVRMAEVPNVPEKDVPVTGGAPTATSLLPAAPQLPAEVGESAVSEVDGVLPVSSAPAIEPTSMPKKISQVEMQGKYVALTFDDGPSAVLTPRVLDILAAHGAKGTFFMLGRAAYNNTSIVARAVAEGHEVGVHTWSHIKMTASTRAKIDSEVSRTIGVIKEASGVTPRLMRPPYGATNKKWVNHMYNTYGLTSVLWDVDTWDWRRPGVEKVVRTAVGEAKPGSIILVHDIHPSTIDALEGIVTGLQARGFRLVTVSELIALGEKERMTPPAPAETEPAVDAVVPDGSLPGSKEEPQPIVPQKTASWPFLQETPAPGSGAVIIRAGAPQSASSPEPELPNQTL